MKVTERFLVCDGKCGKSFGVDNRHFSFARHRQDARNNGWKTVRQLDYCPACAERLQKGNQPAPPPDETEILNELALLKRLPISKRTLKNWRDGKKIPYIKIGRRVIYHWPSVAEALRRLEK